MPKFLVDFEIAGHLVVNAKSANEAKQLVKSMGIEELSENIECFNVGKYYTEKVKCKS